MNKKYSVEKIGIAEIISITPPIYRVLDENKKVIHYECSGIQVKTKQELKSRLKKQGLKPIYTIKDID